MQRVWLIIFVLVLLLALWLWVALRPKRTAHGEYLQRVTHLGFINVYLVKEKDGLTVIDTGVPFTATAIVDAASALNLPIRRVVITHAHPDHVGGVDKLLALSPAAEFIISKRDALLLAGDYSLQAGEAPTPLTPQDLGVQAAPTRLLEVGDMVGSLRAVASPGHTPGHLAFFDARDRTLIAGDALVTVGGVTVSGVKGYRRWRFSLPHSATWDAPTALLSAKQLLALQPSRLAVGHGKVIAQPQARMQHAVDVLERQLAAE